MNAWCLHVPAGDVSIFILFIENVESNVYPHSPKTSKKIRKQSRNVGDFLMYFFLESWIKNVFNSWAGNLSVYFWLFCILSNFLK